MYIVKGHLDDGLKGNDLENGATYSDGEEINSELHHLQDTPTPTQTPDPTIDSLINTSQGGSVECITPTNFPTPSPSPSPHLGPMTGPSSAYLPVSSSSLSGPVLPAAAAVTASSREPPVKKARKPRVRKTVTTKQIEPVVEWIVEMTSSSGFSFTRVSYIAH